MSRRLILVRHGRTAWNHTGLFQGHADIDLDETGRGQAARLASRLGRYKPSRILTSDLLRAHSTASAIAEGLGWDAACLEVDPRLREIDVGSWSGRHRDEVAAEFPEWAASLAEGRDHRRSPEGETGAEAGERVASVLRPLSETLEADETVIVVGHGLSLRVGAALFLGWTVEIAHQLGGLDNCAWSSLQRRHHQWRLESWNNRVSKRVS